MNNNPSPLLNDRFIRRRELLKITSFPSSTLTMLIQQGRFPKPYKLSERASAWKESEIKAWMDSRTHDNANLSGGAA